MRHLSGFRFPHHNQNSEQLSMHRQWIRQHILTLMQMQTDFHLFPVLWNDENAFVNPYYIQRNDINHPFVFLVTHNPEVCDNHHAQMHAFSISYIELVYHRHHKNDKNRLYHTYNYSPDILSFF